MQTQLMLLFLALLSAVCAEVKLAEPVVPEDPRDEDVLPGEERTADADDADMPLAPGPDPALLLDELEHQIFDAVVVGAETPTGDAPPHQRRPRTRSPKKCCKLGREVAENGLFCNADLEQVKKRPNTVHRRKMKFHGPEVHGKTAYKDLMRRVEKCAVSNASSSMFVKCCEWQEDIMYELEQCKSLATLTERRRCRRRVQSRE